MNMIEDNVISFVKDSKQESGFSWLVENLPKYFKDCIYRIELLLTNEADTIIVVIIIGNFDYKDFNEKVFIFSEELISRGYKELYKYLSFQLTT